jgi:hypothetical protein
MSPDEKVAKNYGGELENVRSNKGQKGVASLDK